MSLDYLPVEILVKILKYTNIKDIVYFSYMNKICNYSSHLVRKEIIFNDCWKCQKYYI